MVYIIGLTHWTYIEVLLQISFCSCINSVKQKWISSVPTNLLDCLRTPVLVSVGCHGASRLDVMLSASTFQIRGRSNELKLNISPTFLHILKESSYLIELVNDSDFPIVAKRALSESQSIDFYGKRSRLTVLVQEYNVIRESLTDVEKVLLQHKLTRIETVSGAGDYMLYVFIMNLSMLF